MMQSNKAILAAAGSRKTSFIVEDAIRKNNDGKRVLILTYTRENLNLISHYCYTKAGCIPARIAIQSWFSFLLQDGVRPYRNFLYADRRIDNIFFITGGSSTQYIKESDVNRYYFYEGNKIYTDKISKFVVRCNELTEQNLVVRRLEGLYDAIYIDEVQDLAGYDFEIVEKLLQSSMEIILVGDARQATYFTNCSPKFTKYKGKNIIDLFEEWRIKELCSLEFRNECYRGNSAICDFADLLYPTFPKTISRNEEVTGHDGIFLIGKKNIDEYIKRFAPQILRERIDSNTLGLPAINFGLSKGQTFNRVLIFPNGPMITYIENDCTGSLADKTRANMYVAITRARYSVAFFIDKEMKSRRVTPFEPETYP